MSTLNNMNAPDSAYVARMNAMALEPVCPTALAERFVHQYWAPGDVAPLFEFGTTADAVEKMINMSLTDGSSDAEKVNAIFDSGRCDKRAVATIIADKANRRG